jgi:electron transfer flavoprotein alpha subunit
MAVLLIAETQGGALAADAVSKTLTAARALGGEIHALVAGEGVEAAAQEVAKLNGVAKVLVADAPALAHGLAEPLADLVVGMAGPYDHIVAPASTMGKNVAPRIAALLDVMVLTDVSEVLGADSFVRPIYAGNAFQEVVSSDAKKVLTIRPTSFEASDAQEAAPIEAVAAAEDPGLSSWVEDSVASTDRPELTSAKIVVSGGRALGSKENFAMIEAIADKLGAAIGASRAAVDSGYAPNDWQVGQTGKVVAPQLYIAIGISGAIQHLAGMKDSKVIVAINKDEEAPIFQVADYGLVADLFTALPELEKKLG